MAVDLESLGGWVPGDIKVTGYAPPGMYLDGTGDYASTPDNASLDITSDIDIRVAALAASWTPGSAQSFVAKWRASGNQESYELQLPSSGALQLGWTTSGGTEITRNSSAGIGANDYSPILLRATLDVDDGAGNHVVKFYTRKFFFTTFMDDLNDDTIAAGAWVQLGTTSTTAGTTSIFSSTAPLEVGVRDGGRYLNGGVFGVVVKSGIAGTAVANPNFGAQSDNTASFDDDAGRTWSMNGDAYMVPNVMGGWLLCDGASLDTTTYSNLFAFLRYRHGGSGSNFNIPDVMTQISGGPSGGGRYLRAGWKVGITGGSPTHTHPTHTSGGTHQHTSDGGHTHTTAGSHGHDGHSSSSNTAGGGALNRLTGPSGHAFEGGHTHDTIAGHQHDSTGGHTHDAHSTANHEPSYAAFAAWIKS